jgi:hypothetical protein
VLTIDRRFCGPPSSGNGGYVAGKLAALVRGPAVRVTLRQPPPLEVPLTLRHDGEVAQLTFGGAIVAEAAPTADELHAVDPVGDAAAAEAEAAYAGWENHPFPTCFVCGRALCREPQD